MTETLTDSRTLRIRFYNDLLRRSLCFGGMLVLTQGVRALPTPLQLALLRRLQAFDDFSADNDPHGEHDFGSLEFDGVRVLWKIDYYDASLRSLSEDPADLAVPRRVLTLMLTEEY
ncbi:DUF3768 domain-containing protein [Crenobacter intestini]|uniref:DUF3768 domain-containing protein n=1 Tax=Crenobacter intestini TaxID=2563443 RepID=A0A4T0UPT5_9NEIS|nr:DUF3768 domain-containing protein [Crenobacter intestini]TIC80521.1 DUF3768 domain-containing protein [Crenobacter intestini]